MIALRPTNGSKPLLSPTGQTVYDLTFPVNPTPVEGQLGHYTVSVSTNLPEGTSGRPSLPVLLTSSSTHLQFYKFARPHKSLKNPYPEPQQWRRV
jgi:hypothetical protein